MQTAENGVQPEYSIEVLGQACKKSANNILQYSLDAVKWDLI